MTEDQCHDAAKAAGVSVYAVYPVTNYPVGCYRRKSNKRFYYNTNPHGSENHAQLVCTTKKHENTTPTKPKCPVVLIKCKCDK